MNYNDYIKHVKGFESPAKGTIIIPGLQPFDGARLMHAALGLSTECLELSESIRNRRPIEEQLAELGDICWFSAVACDAIGALPNLAKIAPLTGIHYLYNLCEGFASRIKAAAWYGSPVKPDDTLDYWKKFPPRIFEVAVSIGNQHGHVLEANVAKLTARNKGAQHNTAATINRDEKTEFRAVANVAEVKQALKSTGILEGFVADSKRGKIKLDI